MHYFYLLLLLFAPFYVASVTVNEVNPHNCLNHFEPQPSISECFDKNCWFWDIPLRPPNKNINPFTLDKLNSASIELKKRIVGQDEIIDSIVGSFERQTLGFTNETGPLASFLFIGSIGVGKTQLAVEIADVLFEGQSKLIKLNMGDYSNDLSSVSRLIGLPRGFMGAESGGELSEKLKIVLKSNPYAIILLDEIDKASYTVLDLFHQVFETGFLTDAWDRKIDCRKCIFICTSSLCSQKILTGHDLGQTRHQIERSIAPTLMNYFTPLFYDRLDVVIFNKLNEKIASQLIKHILDNLFRDFEQKLNIHIDYKQSLVNFFRQKIEDYALGTRPIQEKINKVMGDIIVKAIKENYLSPCDLAKIYCKKEKICITNEKKDFEFSEILLEDPKEIEPPFNFDHLVNLESILQEKVVGQPHAINITVSALKRYAVGLKQPNTPIGAFLYIGPTGVGKTELAKELARQLLGGEEHLIRLDMSEYSDQHSITRLIGSPPGYVNHEEGGQLTEALKKHPYAVVLLDEIEKAHPHVRKIFLQIFDEGRVSDAQGTLINCQNVIFICTTNIASDQIVLLEQKSGHVDEFIDSIKADVMKQLSPELYNRLEVALFQGLGPEFIDNLVNKFLYEVQNDLRRIKNIEIEWNQSLKDFLSERGYDYELGARPLRRLIKKYVVGSISNGIVDAKVEAGDRITISYLGTGKIGIYNKTKNLDLEFKCAEDPKEVTPPFNFDHLLNLENILKQKVLGQDAAIHMTVSALKRYAAGFKQPNAPIGAFLYIGPTGVGKTELAKELAQQLLGSVNHLIRLDMSEYSESHTVSRLIGSPPGYVGHDEGGQLSEELKKHPYAIVLLDEIEKSHPFVRKLFLQIFDEGRLTDAKGKLIDCKNIIFICTTNVEAKQILLFDDNTDADEIIDYIKPAVMEYLSPELYNRLEIALFKGLSPDLEKGLINKFLQELRVDIKRIKDIEVEFEKSVIEFLSFKGFDYELGARPLKRLIKQSIVTTIATAIIAEEIESGDNISISYLEGKVVIVKIDSLND